MDIQNFTAEFKKTFIYDMLCETLEDEQLFEHAIVGNQVIWMKEQTRQIWSMWQVAKAQAVPEGFVLVEKKKIESWYLDEHEGMYTDEPDNFLHELEIGEVQAVEHRDYLIIKERTLYAARPWDNDSQEPDCWHFYEAKSEAESVADHCKKKWNEDEAQEPSHD